MLFCGKRFKICCNSVAFRGARCWPATVTRHPGTFEPTQRAEEIRRCITPGARDETACGSSPGDGHCRSISHS